MSLPLGTTQYTALVVGCGAIGSALSYASASNHARSHAQAYTHHPRTRLVGVSDTDPIALARACREWGVDGDLDAVEICNRLRPDIVSVCTPDDTHAPIARKILETAPPRTLFIEKPLAITSREASELVTLAQQNGCAISVNFSRRFSPAFQQIRDDLQAGVYGTPLLARFLYGKGLRHNGIHAIDLLRFWLGDPIEASGSKTCWAYGDDFSYNADLLFPNGCRARLDAFDETAATVFELDFLTDHARWRFTMGGERWEFFELRDNPQLPGYRNYFPARRTKNRALFHRPMAKCLWNSVANIAKFLDGNALLLSTGHDGVAALEWVEKIQQSWVCPEEIGIRV